MNFTKFLVHLIFLEFTVYFICAQNPTYTLDIEDEDEEEESNSTMTSFEDDDAVSILNNVRTMDQFLPLLRRHGHSVTWDDLLSEYNDVSGKVVIEGGGRMAEPDDCSPRNSTVRLSVESTEHNVIHFPRCTKVERCGGCCASPHLQCQPAYTERVILKVVKAQVPYPGSPHLIYEGFAPAIVERHVTCRVVCTLNRRLCGSKKVFRRNQCKCQCRRYENCNPPKIWDAEECACKCQSVTDCCEGTESCNLVFDHSNCQCRVDSGRMHISSGTNVTEEEIEDYYSRRNLTRPTDNNVDGDDDDDDTEEAETSPSTTSTTTTTTTTPTTTTPTTTTTVATTSTTTRRMTTVNPCIVVRCPRMFRKVRDGSNCFCEPRRRLIGRVRNHIIRG